MTSPAPDNPPSTPPRPQEWVPKLLRAILYSRLTMRQKTVLQTILQQANWREWQCTTRQYALAERCGVSTATVCRAVRELEELHLVTTETLHIGRRQLTRWKIDQQAILALPPASCRGHTRESAPVLPGPGLDTHPEPTSRPRPASEPPSRTRPAIDPTEPRDLKKYPAPLRTGQPSQPAPQSSSPSLPPPSPPVPEAMAPGIWIYVTPGALQADTLAQLGALLGGASNGAGQPMHATGPSRGAPVMTRTRTAFTDFTVADGVSRNTGKERNFPCKNNKLVEKLEFHFEISTRGGGSGMKFHPAMHLSSLDLNPASSLSDASSSSSPDASPQHETASRCRADGLEALPATTPSEPPATAPSTPADATPPLSATGLAADAPLRSAPQVGGLRDLDLPLRLLPSPLADGSPASKAPHITSRAKAALREDGAVVAPQAPEATPQQAALPSVTGQEPRQSAALPAAETTPERPAPSQPHAGTGGAVPEPQRSHLATFMAIVHRWSGQDGEPPRWNAPPGLERWFLAQLASDRMAGLDPDEVLIGWSAYLANRAARGQDFSTPTNSLLQQLAYTQKQVARRRRNARLQDDTPLPPRLKEGAVAALGPDLHLRVQCRRLYPISVSFLEYSELLADTAEPPISWEDFCDLARSQGSHPIP